jgi:hypothetical protein
VKFGEDFVMSLKKVFAAFLSGVLLFAATGCSTSVRSQRDALLLEVRQRNAPIGVVARMQNLQPLRADDLVALHKSTVPERVMADYINLTGTSYVLNQETISRLRKEGLSREFVDFLLATPQLYPQVVRVVDYVPAPYPVYYPVYVKRR